jgi:hypothetical protein
MRGRVEGAAVGLRRGDRMTRREGSIRRRKYSRRR